GQFGNEAACQDRGEERRDGDADVGKRGIAGPCERHASERQHRDAQDSWDVLAEELVPAVEERRRPLIEPELGQLAPEVPDGKRREDERRHGGEQAPRRVFTLEDPLQDVLALRHRQERYGAEEYSERAEAQTPKNGATGTRREFADDPCRSREEEQPLDERAQRSHRNE